MDNGKEQPMGTLRRIPRSVKRFWYKRQLYTPFYAISFGKFRVLYQDAKDYAEIFKGKVIDNF